MSTRIITLDELRENKARDSLYILIHGKGTRQPITIHLLPQSHHSPIPVYNVTKFMDEVLQPPVNLKTLNATKSLLQPHSIPEETRFF